MAELQEQTSSSSVLIASQADQAGEKNRCRSIASPVCESETIREELERRLAATTEECSQLAAKLSSLEAASAEKDVTIAYLKRLVQEDSCRLKVAAQKKSALEAELLAVEARSEAARLACAEWITNLQQQIDLQTKFTMDCLATAGNSNSLLLWEGNSTVVSICEELGSCLAVTTMEYSQLANEAVSLTAASAAAAGRRESVTLWASDEIESIPSDASSLEALAMRVEHDADEKGVLKAKVPPRVDAFDEAQLRLQEIWPDAAEGPGWVGDLVGLMESMRLLLGNWWGACPT